MDKQDDQPELQRLLRIAAAVDVFSFWTTEPVAKAPHVELAAWRVMQLPDGTRHFVGTNLLENSSGRVSSRIVNFDAARATAITDSGRAYLLVGPDGRSGDSDYVWRRWVEQEDVAEWLDVTTEVVEDIRNAQGSK